MTPILCPEPILHKNHTHTTSRFGVMPRIPGNKHVVNSIFRNVGMTPTLKQEITQYKNHTHTIARFGVRPKPSRENKQ